MLGLATNLAIEDDRGVLWRTGEQRAWPPHRWRRGGRRGIHAGGGEEEGERGLHIGEGEEKGIAFCAGRGGARATSALVEKKSPDTSLHALGEEESGTHCPLTQRQRIRCKRTGNERCGRDEKVGLLH